MPADGCVSAVSKSVWPPKPPGCSRFLKMARMGLAGYWLPSGAACCILFDDGITAREATDTHETRLSERANWVLGWAPSIWVTTVGAVGCGVVHDGCGLCAGVDAVTVTTASAWLVASAKARSTSAVWSTAGWMGAPAIAGIDWRRSHVKDWCCSTRRCCRLCDILEPRLACCCC